MPDQPCDRRRSPRLDRFLVYGGFSPHCPYSPRLVHVAAGLTFDGHAGCCSSSVQNTPTRMIPCKGLNGRCNILGSHFAVVFSILVNFGIFLNGPDRMPRSTVAHPRFGSGGPSSGKDTVHEGNATYLCVGLGSFCHITPNVRHRPQAAGWLVLA
jgi:hypothetical protein